MARFKRGLIVGKFSPLHHGHEALIHHAVSCCEEVFVISYSNPEFPGCAASVRDGWLAELFPQVRRLLVTEGLMQVPPNDAADDVHRDFCAHLCETHFRTQMDAVFTSEDYGTGFAEHLSKRWRIDVAHVSLDRARVTVPISGSAIRADVHAHRKWLSPCVYASFVQRVCILGGESSGKSVLAAALAARLSTTFVAEYGRELWVKKAGQLVYEDLLDIARCQVEIEEAAARRAYRYLFCDTSPLTTLFYSREMFGSADPALESLASRHYDIYVLCAADFDFVQDGTRRDDDFRQRQHGWYVDQLDRAGVCYLLAKGPLAARVARVAAQLEFSQRPLCAQR